MQAFIISLMLFFIPFFWFSPNELDMGGDSARLWLYQPIEYLRSTAFYSVDPQGLGKIAANQYLLPYVLMHEGIRRLLSAPSILVGLEKGLKLSLSFYFVYVLVRDILKKLRKKKQTSLASECAALASGLWYALSGSVTANMGYALLTHNQVFLNPMMIWLFFRFLLDGNQLFLLAAILISVLFAQNFSLVAPPQLFAFFPLTLLFLLLLVRFIFRISIPWSRLIIPLLLFVLVHAFHVLPEIQYLANPGSDLFGRAFGKESNAVAYFDAILGLGKVSVSLLQSRFFPLLIIMVGILLTRNRKLTIVTSGFFLITLFLLTANITATGVSLYRKLFLIPGFGMFRNFIGQWQFVYAFFYALLLGFSLHAIFDRLKNRSVAILGTALFCALLIASNWTFLTGSIANIRHAGTNVRAAIIVDAQYETMIDAIRALPVDGKIVTLPFTDFYFQVLGGTNGGAYMGPSTIAYLTGRNDFSGYQIMSPFPEQFMAFAKKKDYESIKRLFAILNIRYIFHNSSPDIYDTRFPGFPYGYMRTSLPTTQQEYVDFILQLDAKLAFESGPYRLYELASYVPLFYSPQTLRVYEAPNGDWYGLSSEFFNDPKVPIGTAYVESRVCKELLNVPCEAGIVSVMPASVSYEKVNPTMYRVKVTGAEIPKMLVFSNQYNSSWQMIGAMHFPVNGYSNAWLVTNGAYDVEMVGQRYADVGMMISFLGGALFIVWGIYLLCRAWYNNRYDR